MTTRRQAVAVVVLAAAGCVGCGENFGTIPVEGRVTFGGLPPPGPGYLFFVPADDAAVAADGTGPRSGSARWDEDGNFRGGTFRAADGLRPGRYAVRIECGSPGSAPAAGPDGVEPVERSTVPVDAKPPPLIVPNAGPRPVRYDLNLP